jgi:small ligand-binding sensory domain FIST
LSEPWPDQTPDGWRDTLDLASEPWAKFILIADPFTFDTETFVRRFDESFPLSVKMGGLASGGTQAGDSSLFLGGQVYRSGLVGVALQGDVEIDPIVAQGCRPIGAPMFVTGCRDNMLLELDGRRPGQVLEELYAKAEARDRQLMRSSLFLGLEMDADQQEYQHGDFLIRNLLGMDAENGAVFVAAALRPGQVVQFHLRDARTSADDLELRLTAYARRIDPRCAPEGALLFSCLGRGAHLYGTPDHDSRALRRRFGDLPLGGFFCNGEIGPVQGRTFLHGYTSAFGIFRRRTRLDA